MESKEATGSTGPVITLRDRGLLDGLDVDIRLPRNALSRSVSQSVRRGCGGAAVQECPEQYYKCGSEK